MEYDVPLPCVQEPPTDPYTDNFEISSGIVTCVYTTGKYTQK